MERGGWRQSFEVQDVLPTVLSCAQWKACVLNKQEPSICFIKTIKAVLPAQCASSFPSLEFRVLKDVDLNSEERSSSNIRGAIFQAFQADVIIEAKVHKDLQKKRGKCKQN